MPRYREPDARGLPITEFLYTFDQVAYILNMDIYSLQGHIWFSNLATRKQEWKDNQLIAVEVTPTGQRKREWRIPESELIRYMERLGLVIYEKKLEL